MESHNEFSLQSKDSLIFNLQPLEDPQRNVNECRLCGKVLKSKITELQVHLLKHKSETPGVLKCIFRRCQQTFTSAPDLKEHAVQHWDFSKSEERSGACDFPGCHYAAKNSWGLRIHKSNRHSSDLWTCDLCGKKFKNKFYVLRHIINFHKIQQHPSNSVASVQEPPKI
jgi:hypothetical protein